MEGSEYSEPHPAGDEVVYPDIDETLQYPWQGDQSAQHDSSTTSALDPRLYRDLFSRSTSLLMDQHVLASDYDDEDRDADDLSLMNEDDSSEDPSYDVSDEEDSA